MFQASFHSGVTLRAFDYAPPDTEVSGLQLVALERLPSIERAAEILIDLTFLRGTKAPLKGELAAARLTERLSQICHKTQTANSVCGLERKK